MTTSTDVTRCPECAHPGHNFGHEKPCPLAYRLVVEAADVTQDMIDEAIDIADGWYADEPIDWDDVWRRMETGSDLDFGPEQNTPAMRTIQRLVRAARRQS